MYVCMYVCMYIYIYIERERERERETKILLPGWSFIGCALSKNRTSNQKAFVQANSYQ